MTNEDLQQIKALMKDTVKEELAPVNARLDGMDKRFDGLETNVRQTRVLVEQQEHNIRLIAEQYTSIATKLERVNEIDELRDDVRTLKRVVRNHTERLDELSKAQKAI